MQRISKLDVKSRLNIKNVLETLIANRTRHQAIHQEAVEGFYKQTENILKSHLLRIQERSARTVNFYTSIPTNHLATYDTVIAMLTATEDTEITLNAADFRNLVLDEWDWQKEFLVGTRQLSQASNDYYSEKYEGGHEEGHEEDSA